MSDEKRETAKQRYDKKNARYFTVKAVKTTEADIINRLDSVPNKAGYIKRLIREDIERGE